MPYLANIMFICLSFSLHSSCWKWESWVLQPQINHTDWMTVVASNDRPNSVHNRFEIERFVASLCYFTYVLSVVWVCHTIASDFIPFSWYCFRSHGRIEWFSLNKELLIYLYYINIYSLIKISFFISNYIIISIPSQWSPTMRYPAKHWHEWLPSLLRQIWSHVFVVLFAHSSKSEKKIICRCLILVIRFALLNMYC